MRQSIRRFLSQLENEEELIHVGEPLSPRFEIPAVLKYIRNKRNVAVQFDNVKGYQVPVVGNLFGSRRRLAIAMGVEEEKLVGKIFHARNNPIEPKLVDSGPVKEVKVLNHVDILRVIPVLIHHKRDAGPYFTCAVTVAKDPETGFRSMGLHRIQVKNRTTLGIFLANPPLSQFLAKAEKNNVSLEIAIAVGVDPLILLASVLFTPSGVDKLSIAGGLLGEPIQLVKCSKVDLEVPTASEFVLEGRIVPGRREKEGPFGETTGCYLTYKNPVVEVVAMMHRKNPIYQGLVPSAGEEDVLLDYSWEVDALKELQKSHPCIREVHMYNVGMLIVVQVEKPQYGEVPVIIEKILSDPFIKIVIVVDSDVDPCDCNDVLWAVSMRFQVKKGLLIKNEEDGRVIDPSASELYVSDKSFSKLIAKTSKIGIDATIPVGDEERYEKIDVPDEAKEVALQVVSKILDHDCGE